MKPVRLKSGGVQRDVYAGPHGRSQHGLAVCAIRSRDVVCAKVGYGFEPVLGDGVHGSWRGE